MGPTPRQAGQFTVGHNLTTTSISEPQCQGRYNWAVPGGNKYGNLAVQIWRISKLRVKYGQEKENMNVLPSTICHKMQEKCRHGGIESISQIHTGLILCIYPTHYLSCAFIFRQYSCNAVQVQQYLVTVILKIYFYNFCN
jgi:hypothetical protein